MMKVSFLLSEWRLFRAFAAMAVLSAACASCGPGLWLSERSAGSNLSLQVSFANSATHLASGGSTLQADATETTSSGASIDVTSSVTWSSSNGAVASVSNSGLLTSGSVGGITSVTATLGDVSGSASFTVTGPVTSVTVGNDPGYAALRPNANEVWVSNSTDRTISIIDTTTNTVTDTIPDLGAGKSPGEIRFLNDGSKAYVVTNGGNTVEVINASTKAVGTPLSIAGAFQIVLASDGATLFVAGSGGITAINSSNDSTSSYYLGSGCSGANGVATAGTHVYRSEQCHAPSDFIYDYPSLTSSASSTTFDAGGPTWAGGTLYASPNGSVLFGNAGNNTDPETTYSLSGDTPIGVIASYKGAWSFLPDDARGIMARMNTSGTMVDYGVYDYSNTSAVASFIESIAYVPAENAVAGITSNSTLYLPINASTTIQVYQYY